MSKQALHANMRTLGGIFCFHNFFQTILSIPTRECSAAFGCWSRRATWYADFTVNLWALFFVQQSLSPVCMFPSLILRVSVRVLSWNVSWITALFHWWVSGVIKPLTRKLRFAPRQMLGGWGSHLWLFTPIVQPSPIFQVLPSLIMSRAWSKLHHTKEGLNPSSAYINEHVGKYLALYTQQNNDCSSMMSL